MLIIWGSFKAEEKPFRILDIKVHQGVTIGSSDAEPILLCFLGIKGCPPQVFKALYKERLCQILPNTK